MASATRSRAASARSSGSAGSRPASRTGITGITVAPEANVTKVIVIAPAVGQKSVRERSVRALNNDKFRGYLQGTQDAMNNLCDKGWEKFENLVKEVKNQDGDIIRREGTALLGVSGDDRTLAATAVLEPVLRDPTGTDSGVIYIRTSLQSYPSPINLEDGDANQKYGDINFVCTSAENMGSFVEALRATAVPRLLYTGEPRILLINRPEYAQFVVSIQSGSTPKAAIQQLESFIEEADPIQVNKFRAGGFVPAVLMDPGDSRKVFITGNQIRYIYVLPTESVLTNVYKYQVALRRAISSGASQAQAAAIAEASAEEPAVATASPAASSLSQSVSQSAVATASRRASSSVNAARQQTAANVAAVAAQPASPAPVLGRPPTAGIAADLGDQKRSRAASIAPAVAAGIVPVAAAAEVVAQPPAPAAAAAAAVAPLAPGENPDTVLASIEAASSVINEVENRVIVKLEAKVPDSPELTAAAAAEPAAKPISRRRSIGGTLLKAASLGAAGYGVVQGVGTLAAAGAAAATAASTAVTAAGAGAVAAGAAAAAATAPLAIAAAGVGILALGSKAAYNYIAENRRKSLATASPEAKAALVANASASFGEQKAGFDNLALLAPNETKEAVEEVAAEEAARQTAEAEGAPLAEANRQVQNLITQSRVEEVQRLVDLRGAQLIEQASAAAVQPGVAVGVGGQTVIAGPGAVGVGAGTVRPLPLPAGPGSVTGLPAGPGSVTGLPSGGAVGLPGSVTGLPGSVSPAQQITAGSAAYAQQVAQVLAQQQQQQQQQGGLPGLPGLPPLLPGSAVGLPPRLPGSGVGLPQQQPLPVPIRQTPLPQLPARPLTVRPATATSLAELGASLQAEIEQLQIAEAAADVAVDIKRQEATAQNAAFVNEQRGRLGQHISVLREVVRGLEATANADIAAKEGAVYAAIDNLQNARASVALAQSLYDRAVANTGSTVAIAQRTAFQSLPAGTSLAAAQAAIQAAGDAKRQEIARNISQYTVSIQNSRQAEATAAAALDGAWASLAASEQRWRAEAERLVASGSRVTPVPVLPPPPPRSNVQVQPQPGIAPKIEPGLGTVIVAGPGPVVPVVPGAGTVQVVPPLPIAPVAPIAPVVALPQYQVSLPPAAAATVQAIRRDPELEQAVRQRARELDSEVARARRERSSSQERFERAVAERDAQDRRLREAERTVNSSAVELATSESRLGRIEDTSRAVQALAQGLNTVGEFYSGGRFSREQGPLSFASAAPAAAAAAAPPRGQDYYSLYYPERAEEFARARGRERERERLVAATPSSTFAAASRVSHSPARVVSRTTIDYDDGTEEVTEEETTFYSDQPTATTEDYSESSSFY